MNEVQQITELAKGISDFGVLVVIGAIYLALSALMMIAIFKWFKNIIDRIMGQQQKELRTIVDRIRENGQAITMLTEGVRPNTLLRVRNLSGFAFDLSIEQVCRLIKRVREENHIADREATAAKIRKSLSVIHEDRKSRFDSFTYNGQKLSDYCNPEWIEQVASVVESEIYNEDGVNNSRAYTNIKLAYDDIKTDFYKRLNN
ncbi:hypothetical protein [Phocaeicola faecalis]